MKNITTYINESRTILYVAIDLDEQSREVLRMLSDNPEGWDKNDTVLFHCDHSTIAFGNNVDRIKEWVKSNEGKRVEMTATEIGSSDKAYAVKVEYKSDIPYQNETPHVTIATNVTNHGKPFDSNKITSWKKISGVKLFGNVKIHYKH